MSESIASTYGFVTREILLGYVEQIEGVFAAIDDLGQEKKAIYQSAHDAGIEKTALGKVVSFRRQRGKNPARFDEQDALVQKYLGLLDGTVEDLEPHARIRAREVAEQMRTRTEFFERIAQERADGYPRRGENSVVYFLHAEAADVIKIGVTNDLDRRMGSLMHMSPLPLKLLLTIPGNHKTEGEFHQRFAPCRLHGEWFSATDGAILDFVENYLPEHDPTTGEIIEHESAPADDGEGGGEDASASLAEPIRQDDPADAVVGGTQPADDRFHSEPGNGQAGETPVVATRQGGEEPGTLDSLSAAPSNIVRIQAKPLRPYCHPDHTGVCASPGGKVHCHRCETLHAAGAREVVAGGKHIEHHGSINQ